VVTLALGLGLAGEAWTDPVLVERYGPTTLSGEVQLFAELPRSLVVVSEVGYGRFLSKGSLAAEGAWIYAAPMSVLLGAHHRVGSIDLYGAAGPTLVAWGERPGIGGSTDVYATNGGKWGLGAEIGARLGTGWVQPSLRHPGRGVQDLELVASAGGRLMSKGSQAGCAQESCGLDFSAIRFSGGVLARF
jgi:hypothetical protein